MEKRSKEKKKITAEEKNCWKVPILRYVGTVYHSMGGHIFSSTFPMIFFQFPGFGNILFSSKFVHFSCFWMGKILACMGGLNSCYFFHDFYRNSVACMSVFLRDFDFFGGFRSRCYGLISWMPAQTDEYPPARTSTTIRHLWYYFSPFYEFLFLKKITSFKVFKWLFNQISLIK